VKYSLLLALVLVAARSLSGDAGVLIPAGKEQPDPAIFELQDLSIDVFVDNGTARVRIREIFLNKTNVPQEGEYHFALPAKASVSDFAVWDDVTRIPGVILERKRAGELYAQIKAQMIDPGLLQMGERGADEARRNSMFTAKIVPVPAWSTKRIEIEYQEPIAVESLRSVIAVPIHPDVYTAIRAGHMTAAIEIQSAHAIQDFAEIGKAYPFQVRATTPNNIKADFSGTNVSLTEDFAFGYSYTTEQAGILRVITQREQEEGFFGARALLPQPPQSTGHAPHAPRTVIALFDTSLSMQWDKLERSFAACETLLKRLDSADTFNLLLFDSTVRPWEPAPKPATAVNVEQALAFIRASKIRNGTDLERALNAGFSQARSGTGEPYIVLISDGGANEGTVNNGKLAARIRADWRKFPEDKRPHIFTFAVGDDADLPLMRSLAGNNGVFEWVRSTEPIDFKLNAFLSKIGQQPIKSLTLATQPAANFDLIYGLEDVRFAGSAATWVGQYKKALMKAEFSVNGVREGSPLHMAAAASLPSHEIDHPELPRLWARARVDALLEKIDRDGEDQKSIDEIIRLSKKYKFVTPYTSFLAVPRSLLRPRVIRPGDPVLRIRTDPSIVSVIALFPFGLVKPLRFLTGEEEWQTRFLAPIEMTDGTYQVRLILRDRDGHVYRESKSFVIASKPPVVRVRLGQQHVRGGDLLRVSVLASANTRTISARLFGAEPVQLRWNSAAKANTGDIAVPRGMPPGRYMVKVTAEDIAHNIAAQEAPVEIW
jgi:Ca-activated chloride channel family protein